MWSRRTVKADARRQLRRCLPAAAAIALLLAVTDGSQTFQQIYQIVSGLLSYLGRWTLPPLPTLPAPVSLLVGLLLFFPPAGGGLPVPPGDGPGGDALPGGAEDLLPRLREPGGGPSAD